MSDDQSNDPTSKSKPLEIVVDEGRGGADLNCIGVIGRVLKQAVVGVEDLTGEKEKELTTWTTIVKSKGGRERGIDMCKNVIVNMVVMKAIYTPAILTWYM